MPSSSRQPFLNFKLLSRIAGVYVVGSRLGRKQPYISFYEAIALCSSRIWAGIYFLDIISRPEINPTTFERRFHAVCSYIKAPQTMYHAASNLTKAPSSCHSPAPLLLGSHRAPGPCGGRQRLLRGASRARVTRACPTLAPRPAAPGLDIRGRGGGKERG